MSRALLLAQLFVIFILATLHLFGLEYFLYWRFVWLDVVAHTLGGMWAAIFFLWGRSLVGYSPSIVWGIAAALVLGVGWEIFEIATGLTIEANYAFDTSVDLLMDAVGGAAGAFIAGIIIKRHGAQKTVI